jgi:hypothetical protein
MGRISSTKSTNREAGLRTSDFELHSAFAIRNSDLPHLRQELNLRLRDRLEDAPNIPPSLELSRG